jgi:hypothetical protein
MVDANTRSHVISRGAKGNSALIFAAVAPDEATS